MSEKIVFVRTSDGEDEARSRTARLSKDIKRALLMVDGTATVAEIMKRSSPSLRGMLGDMFRELVKGGFIQDKAKVAHLSTLVTPQSASPKKSSTEVDELDFTAAFRVPTQAMLAEEAARVQIAAKTAAETMAREETERQASVAAKAAREAEQHAVEVKAETAAHAAAEQKVRLEAEAAKAQALA